MAGLKSVLYRLVNQNALLRRAAKGTVRALWNVEYQLIRSRCRTDEKLYVFEAYQGRQYACSPRAIYEELLKKEAAEGFSFIWVFREPEKYAWLMNNPNTTLVKLGTRAYYKAFARAKFWIINSRTRHCLVPAKDQCFLQTWHGTPLKRLGCDITVEGNNVVSSAEMKKDYRKEGGRVTYFLSPSSFYSEKIASAFALNEREKSSKILELGYPRNDELFRPDSAKNADIKARLGILEGKKVILYAPTFRDNQHTKDGCAFTMGFELDNFCRELGNDYVMLFRTHYFITEQVNLKPYSGMVIDVSNWDNINELYLVSDLLVTDYSSVFFDYANLRRPILFFMYDLLAYQESIRDFYLDIRELPGDIVKTEEELYRAVRRVCGTSVYDERYRAFHEKFNYLDGPHTGRTVINCLHSLYRTDRRG